MTMLFIDTNGPANARVYLNLDRAVNTYDHQISENKNVISKVEQITKVTTFRYIFLILIR